MRPVDGKKITEGWVEEEEEVEEEVAEEAAVEEAPAAEQPAVQQVQPAQMAVPMQMPQLPAFQMPQIQVPAQPATAGIKLIIKDAKIYIDKVIVKSEEKKGGK